MVTKDEFQKMLNTIYEGKNRNDETQTPVTHVIGHNHHDKKKQFIR